MPKVVGTLVWREVVEEKADAFPQADIAGPAFENKVLAEILGGDRPVYRLIDDDPLAY